ncbi:MAG: carboxyltransferase domain-containing protein, partial [Gemmataceae bacterium]
MKLVPLGDQAVLAYQPDEAAAVRLAAAVRGANPPWLQDVVPAYASVGVFFDADATTGADVRAWLAELPATHHPTTPPPHSHLIPVCYEMHLDLPRVCGVTGLSADEVIRLHTTAEVTVYAVG